MVNVNTIQILPKRKFIYSKFISKAKCANHHAWPQGTCGEDSYLKSEKRKLPDLQVPQSVFPSQVKSGLKHW